jgi:hypothetical protein
VRQRAEEVEVAQHREASRRRRQTPAPSIAAATVALQTTSWCLSDGDEEEVGERKHDDDGEHEDGGRI